MREVRKSDNWQTAEATCKTPEYGGGVRLQDTGRAVDVRTRRDNQAQQCVDQIESALSRVNATEATRNFYAKPRRTDLRQIIRAGNTSVCDMETCGSDSLSQFVALSAMTSTGWRKVVRP